MQSCLKHEARDGGTAVRAQSQAWACDTTAAEMQTDMPTAPQLSEPQKPN